jgi:KDO2-lipid IV(A) lauroyltransferase
VVGILPDQQPKAGDGEFAPFFGVPALTMTLLPRLAARTDAIVLFAWCERIGADPDTGAPRFALHIDPAPAELSAPDPVTGVHALNAAVEAIARRDPAQYQWTYKRYTLQPPGSGERNPYRDLERH